MCLLGHTTSDIHDYSILAHLVKGNYINATTEVDVLGVQTVDSFLLKSLLSKGVVGCQS